MSVLAPSNETDAAGDICVAVASTGSFRPRSAFEKSRRRVTGLILVVLLVAALFNARPQRGSILLAMMEYAGLGVLIVSSFGRIWSAVYLSGRKSKELCSTGPYSLSRNPLYFFSFMATVGLALLTGSVTLIAVVAVVFLVYYHYVIGDEERRLRERFGELFDRYCARVPRLFPRLSGFDDPETLELHTRSFRKTIMDTSVLLAVFMALKFGEILRMMFPGHDLPVLWHLP